ncbi:MAG: TlpA family protein disulfide reductase [Pseudomonadota bacterium]
MRTTLSYIAVALVAAALGFFWHSQQRGPKPVEPREDTSPLAFELPDLQGQIHRHDDWRGQVVMINFWATWCPPCKKEIPDFIRLQDDLADRDIQVVGIAIDEARKVTEFVDEIGGINYPQLIASGSGYGLTERYGNEWGTLPYTVFLNRKGEIVARHYQGILTYEEARDQLLSILEAPEKGEQTSDKGS